MSPVEAEDAESTYRQLRIAMPILVAILAAGVVYQIFEPSPNCWLGSISDYYYTSARAVFVACLCAIGTCLVVYRGYTPREDAVLNLPGFLAFAVAFIPTPLQDLSVEVTPDNCRYSNVPSETQLVAALNNNITALLVGATVTVAVIAWFMLRPRTADSGRLRPVVLWAPAVTVLGAWLVFVLSPSTVREHGHIVAAVGLFIGIAFVVLMHAYPVRWLDADARRARQPYLSVYRVILVAMVVVFVIIVPLALADRFDHAVFWLEGWIIALFGAFWIVQTAELWRAGRPGQPVGAGRVG